jgi:hypothetical protein
MKILFNILIILSFLLIISCSEDTKTEVKKECDPTCQTWETCNTDLECILLDNMCNEDKDCEANTDNKTTCDTDKHECIEKVLTCNEEKTASTVKTTADSCGELTKCDDSFDCADNQRCENIYNDVNEYTNPCCVDGLRGCKKTGESCEDEFDCESGLCIEKNDGGYFCSQKCDPDNNACPATVSECKDLYVMFACVEATK